MTYNSPCRILLAESQEITRLGIRAALADNPAFTIVAETGDRAELKALLTEHHPDLVVMDLMLPDCGSVDLCREVRALQPGVKLLIVSACEDDQCLLDAFSLGVNGYLKKDATVSELVDGLTEVAAGGTALDPCLTNRVVESIRNEDERTPKRLIDSLSRQERRVLMEVSKGRSNKQVADALALSEKTVKNYFSSVMRKLSVSRRTEAAALFWNHELSR